MPARREWSCCFPQFSQLFSHLHWSVPLMCDHIHWVGKKKRTPRHTHNIHKTPLWCTQINRPIWDIAFHFCFSGSLDYSGIKCVSWTCVCLHFHMHTQTQENTLITVAGLHRDKAQLLILTHWLNTHTNTHTVYTKPYPLRPVLPFIVDTLELYTILYYLYWNNLKNSWDMYV